MARSAGAFLFARGSAQDRTWQLGTYPRPDRDPADLSGRVVEVIRAATGLPDVDPLVEDVLTWTTGAYVADRMRGGRVLLAGDSAHVMPMGFPPDDRFQILSSHDGTASTLRYDDCLGVHRDDGIVYVTITMRSGRPQAQKQALYRRIAELASTYAGTEPRNMFVALTENESSDWSFGHGLTQYINSTH